MKQIVFSLLFATAISTCIAEMMPVAQKPASCMWIGCSASRQGAGKTLGFQPEQLYVHANLANLFVCSDPSCISSLRHAVEFEKVSQIVVCGTYGCPGVRAALKNEQGAESWLQTVYALYLKNKQALDAISDETKRVNRLVELNVIEQVENIRSHPVVKAASERNQSLKIIGIVQDPQSEASTELICVILN